MNATQEQIAVELLLNCLPHLDLAVSDHNDGDRLRRDICLFLAGLGDGGAYRVRYGPEYKQPALSAPDGTASGDAWPRKVRQG